jgi:hypothetical protein
MKFNAVLTVLLAVGLVTAATAWSRVQLLEPHER